MYQLKTDVDQFKTNVYQFDAAVYQFKTVVCQCETYVSLGFGITPAFIDRPGLGRHAVDDVAVVGDDLVHVALLADHEGLGIGGAALLALQVAR